MQGRFTSSLIIAALALSSPAAGYKLKKTQDDSKVVVWDVAEMEIVIERPIKAGTVDPDRLPGLVDAIRSGFEIWTASGVPIRLTFRVSDKPMPLNPTDGTYVVRFETKHWGYASDAAAMTVSSYKASTGIRTPGADIVLNGVDKRWTTAPAQHKDSLDIQSVIAHEAGHFFGLDHSTVAIATMYATTLPGDAHKRQLAADDRQGLAALVQAMSQHRAAQSAPHSSPTTSTAADPLDTTAGCSVVVGHGSELPGLMLVIGLVLVAARVDRRRKS